MKIAQVAPLYESVPPRYYSGTERVVSYFTEELVSEGHEVTLFGSNPDLATSLLDRVADDTVNPDEAKQQRHRTHQHPQGFAEMPDDVVLQQTEPGPNRASSSELPNSS